MVYQAVDSSSSLAVAQEIVAQIDHEALAKKIPVTRAVAAQVLERMEKSD